MVNGVVQCAMVGLHMPSGMCLILGPHENSEAAEPLLFIPLGCNEYQASKGGHMWEWELHCD